MHRIIIMLLLTVSSVQAAYITDKLLVGFYSKPDATIQPTKVLPSSTPLEILEKKEVFSRVRLGDGKEGWVKSIYISNEKPARAMLLEQQAKSSTVQNKLRQLEKELKAARAGKAQEASGGGDAKLKAELDQTKKKLLDLGKALKTAQTENNRLKAIAKQSSTKKQAPKNQSKEMKAMKKKLATSESDLKATMHEVKLLQDLLKKSDQTASRRIASLEAQLQKASSNKQQVAPIAVSDKALMQQNARLRQQLQKIRAIIGERQPQPVATKPAPAASPAPEPVQEVVTQAAEQDDTGFGIGTWIFIIALVMVAGFVGYTTLRNLHLRRRYQGFRI